jgi:hypothetical protein
VAAYDRCRGTLAETADARPSPETEELIGRIRIQRQTARPGQQPGILSEASVPIPAPPRSTAQRDRKTLRLRVVPLRTIGEERDDGLGIGLAEEISAGLSRFRWISCLPARLGLLEPPPATPGAILLMMRLTARGPAWKRTSSWMARFSVPWGAFA